MDNRPDPVPRLFELARASTLESRAVALPPGFASKVFRQFLKPVASDADIRVWETLSARFLAGALALTAVSMCCLLFKGERPVAPEDAAAVEMVQVAILER